MPLVRRWSEAFFQSHDIKTLDRPPQSPDLNPIENFLAIIKLRQQDKFGFPKNQEELMEQIFVIWNEIDMELCEKLSDYVVKW